MLGQARTGAHRRFETGEEDFGAGATPGGPAPGSARAGRDACAVACFARNAAGRGVRAGIRLPAAVVHGERSRAGRAARPCEAVTPAGFAGRGRGAGRGHGPAGAPFQLNRQVGWGHRRCGGPCWCGAWLGWARGRERQVDGGRAVPG